MTQAGDTRKWVLRNGDLAYWLGNDRQPVRCRVELVTALRIYLSATATEGGKVQGQVWFESRYSRRVAPRDAVYIHDGRAYVDWRSVTTEEL